MPLTVKLTNEKIHGSRSSSAGGHQKAVQSSDYIPIVVDLSVRITLGLAILNAIKADDALWAEFNEMEEQDILDSITGIALVSPTEAVSIEAYSGAATHKRPALIGEITYIPSTRLYRNYVLGGASAVLLDVLVAV